MEGLGPSRVVKSSGEAQEPCQVACDSVPSLPEWREANSSVPSYLTAHRGLAYQRAVVHAPGHQRAPEPTLRWPEHRRPKLASRPPPRPDAHRERSRVRPHATLHWPATRLPVPGSQPAAPTLWPDARALALYQVSRGTPLYPIPTRVLDRKSV